MFFDMRITFLGIFTCVFMCVFMCVFDKIIRSMFQHWQKAKIYSLNLYKWFPVINSIEGGSWSVVRNWRFGSSWLLRGPAEHLIGTCIMHGWVSRIPGIDLFQMVRHALLRPIDADRFPKMNNLRLAKYHYCFSHACFFSKRIKNLQKRATAQNYWIKKWQMVIPA